MPETSTSTNFQAAKVPVSLIDPRLVRAIELVWREAELLDRREYALWNELYTGDGIYVVPIERTTEDFENTLNMVYDDARMRALRVARMTEGYSIAAVDAARTVRTVSRFVPEAVSDAEVVLRSAQVLIAFKRDRHDMWAADLEHRIRLSVDGPADDRISRKVVRLINSDSALPAAGFLL